MNKGAIRPGSIAVMVVFAFSCFGLLLFLWLSFGGPVPLNPKGYRVHGQFSEATTLAVEADVRISGVPVGKVKSVESDPKTGLADVSIEIDNQYAPLPEDTRIGTASEMLAGGALLLIVSLLLGEPGRLEPGAISPRSVAALAYLTVFGSIIGYTAYLWLLKTVEPAKVGTNFYVNPIVAVFMGWLVLGEAVTPWMLAAAAGHDLDDDGVGLAHSLRRETDGNPFFTGELLRHLGESGGIVLNDEGRWVLAGELDELGLPSSVRDVVGRRVERLGDEPLRRLARLFGGDHDRRAVRVVGADEVHRVAAHALEAHPDVGLDVLHHVADVERRVRVRKRRRDEELAGHRCARSGRRF